MVTGEKSATLITIETIREVKKGEEITVYYGSDYFGEDNKDCLCPECKKKKVAKSNPQTKEFNRSEIRTEIGVTSPAVELHEDELNQSEVRTEIGATSPEVELHEDELNQSEVRTGDEGTNTVEATPRAAQPPVAMSPPREASDDELQLIKREKKVKNTPGPKQCIVCKKLFLRMDKHIETHADRLPETKWRRFILDFYRCRNAPPNMKIYDCSACFRRFRSLPTHKYGPKCSPASITEVPNPGSRSSLPDEIRKALKSDVLPSQNDLEIAEKFIEYRNQLAVCGGNEKWSQDRLGMKQLMAMFYQRTNGLTQPECLVQTCLQIQKERNLKPQTMLSYLSTFVLFCDYCFLYGVGVSSTSNGDRIKAAIKDARKAFAPAAVQNYRETAQEMMTKVPSSTLVRLRIKQIVEKLQNNLEENVFNYKIQQSLNFFLLQARINTRYVLWNNFLKQIELTCNSSKAGRKLKTIN